MSAASYSPLVASAVQEMREVVTLLEYLAKSGQADSKSVLDACRMIQNSVDEIEQVAGPVPDLRRVDLTVTTALPVLTLADVVAAAARAPVQLSIIDGGRQ